MEEAALGLGHQLKRHHMPLFNGAMALPAANSTPNSQFGIQHALAHLTVARLIRRSFDSSNKLRLSLTTPNDKHLAQVTLLNSANIAFLNANTILGNAHIKMATSGNW